MSPLKTSKPSLALIEGIDSGCPSIVSLATHWRWIRGGSSIAVPRYLKDPMKSIWYPFQFHYHFCARLQCNFFFFFWLTPCCCLETGHFFLRSVGLGSPEFLGDFGVYLGFEMISEDPLPFLCYCTSGSWSAAWRIFRGRKVLECHRGSFKIVFSCFWSERMSSGFLTV